MSLVIPLISTPSQTLACTLAGQSCQIAVYQKSTGVFLDLVLVSTPIITAALCRDRVSIVREVYLGFVGSLVFIDTQGADDPDYTGFGTRFQLVYLP